MKTFFMKQNYFFLIPILWGCIFSKRRICYLFGLKVFIFAFIVEIIFLLTLCHMFEVIFFPSSTILKKKVTLSNKGSQSDSMTKRKK